MRARAGLAPERLVCRPDSTQQKGSKIDKRRPYITEAAARAKALLDADENLPLAHAARAVGISPQTLRYRLNTPAPSEPDTRDEDEALRKVADLVA